VIELEVPTKIRAPRRQTSAKFISNALLERPASLILTNGATHASILNQRGIHFGEELVR